MRTLFSALLLCGLPVLAQTSPKFDAATIKLHPGSDTSSRTNLEDHGLRVTNVTLLRLITLAYTVNETQVVDVPAWLRQEHWDIQAKSLDLPPTPAPEQVIPLIRALLEERFALKVHREPRPQSIYRLVIDRNGPKLNRSAEQTPGGTSTNRNATRVHIKAERINMDEFARVLTRQLSRQVVNQTGLTDFFDIELAWVPELAVPDGDASEATVFTAIREQLGLRLESGKEPVDVLVIDAASRPTDN